MTRIGPFVISLAIAVLVMILTITPLCGQLFACGCNFVAGMAYCNVHDPGPSCPWCGHGAAGFYIPFALIVLVAAATTLEALRRNRWRWWVGLIGGLLGYLGGALLVALGTGLYRGYPYFLWWEW